MKLNGNTFFLRLHAAVDIAREWKVGYCYLASKVILIIIIPAASSFAAVFQIIQKLGERISEQPM